MNEVNKKKYARFCSFNFMLSYHFLHELFQNQSEIEFALFGFEIPFAFAPVPVEFYKSNQGN